MKKLTEKPTSKLFKIPVIFQYIFQNWETKQWVSPYLRLISNFPLFQTKTYNFSH